MKVALVHDFLNNKLGGAEYILLELAEMYPDAPVFTLLHNHEVYEGVIDPDRVKTPFVQSLPGWLRKRHRYLLPLLPTAVEQFDLTDYDVVISSSSAFAKSVITRPETLHICYCHTPMRFVWDYWPRYVDEQHVDPIRKALIHRMTSKLRVWDYSSSTRVDKWIANSNTTAARIKKYYRQDTDAVVYPGVNLEVFSIADKPHQDYYVTFGSLTPYKKFDLAIDACNRMNRKLVVMGDGADRARLEALAGPTVSFLGRVSDEKKAEVMANAKALIFAGIEDFGIVPVEAMASGVPVIGYNEGGLTETVIDGKTGILFNDQTVDSLMSAIQERETKTFDAQTIRAHAMTFDRKIFREKISKLVNKWHQEYVKAN